MYRHRQRRTLHLGHVVSRAKLACGRPLTPAMAVFRGRADEACSSSSARFLNAHLSPFVYLDGGGSEQQTADLPVL